MKNKIAEILKSGGIGVLPTDTIYGLVGSALRPEAVARIYRVRRRDSRKPLIILISSVNDISGFGIRISPRNKRIMEKIWPGKISAILPIKGGKFSYLHRGIKSLAFRLPDKKSLLEILRKTGPLVAPSANPAGLPPAENIKEAREYFGGGVDFYSSGKGLSGQSTILDLSGRKPAVLREGSGLYKCRHCGFHYRQKAFASGCARWHAVHKGANPRLAVSAIESIK